MKIVVSGGTGFVGRPLCQELLARGYQVTALGSRERLDPLAHPNYIYLPADTSRKGRWQSVLADADGVVNLTGRSIFKRWTRSYKGIIRSSRLETTRNLVDGLSSERPTVFISTSAIGYYGDTGEATVTEASPPTNDFLGTLAQEWEATALKARNRGARVALMRFGVVLGKGGGALAKMLPPFRLGAGGPIGSGRQWFSWIHLDDLVAAVIFLLESENTKGPYNFCAPAPVRNGELAATLGKILHRPAMLPVPAVMIKLAMGEFGHTLLGGQRVLPERLTQAGYEFQYPILEKALKDLV